MENKISYKIRELRINKNISQKMLAIKSNLSPATISRIEAGNLDPTTLSLINICNALNTTPNELLSFEINNKNNNFLTKDEIELVTKYKQLDEKTKKSIQMFIRSLVENKETYPKNKKEVK